MPLPPGFAAIIESRLKEFLADPVYSAYHKVVARFGALPLDLDWNGTFALRRDGEIILYMWDPPHDLRVEKDPRLRNTALHQGSLKYPELKPLVPVKPITAPECLSCKGTGIHPQAVKLGLNNIVCFCGGLGWLPPEFSFFLIEREY